MTGLTVAGGPVHTDHDVWFDNTHPSLRACWHPVARVDDLVGDGPHPVALLGDAWVLVRLGGRWSLLPDRCPHRLAPLSAGTICDDTIRCAYHGWRFDGSGRCVGIPAIGDAGRVPPAAHLAPAHAVREAHGLLWATIEAPLTPLPRFPEWGDDRFTVIDLPLVDWQASAAQMADNFLDVAHFPFTHVATIGDPDDTVVGDYELVRDGWVFSAHHVHTARTLDGSGAVTRRTMDFECTAPHHVRLRLDYGHQVVALGFFHQPLDAHTTRLYGIDLDTSIRGDPDAIAAARAFQMAVGAEDRRLLERIDRAAVPLSPGHEVHTRADRITVELRRVLADLIEARRHAESDPGPAPTSPSPPSPPVRRRQSRAG